MKQANGCGDLRSECGGLWGGRLWRIDELPSTNTWAIEHANELGHGDVVVATNQTAGRGRMDRTWLALPGRCLTFSFVVKHPGFAGLGANLGQIVACAVADFLASHNIPAALKWPNDVLVGGAKIAGILAEQDLAGETLVVGVGLNINLTHAELTAGGLRRPATSMRDTAGRVFDVEALCRPLLQCIERRLDQARMSGLALLWESWSRIDWLKGRPVRVMTADRCVEGECLGMDTGGRLRLRAATGQEETFWSGDVERVGLTD
jgi:BirA family biotin operon repressor/biotin-[acetyl-CoA-carboxylase] ligase